MKNVIYLFTILFLATACSSDSNSDTTANNNTETNTSLQVKSTGNIAVDAVAQLLSNISNGLKPHTPIANRTKFDPNTTARTWKNEPTGDFRSEKVVGDYDVWYDYICFAEDQENLEAVTVDVSLLEKVEESPDKAINIEEVIALISKELKVEKSYDEENQEYHWKIKDIDYILSVYGDYSFQFSANAIVE